MPCSSSRIVCDERTDQAPQLLLGGEAAAFHVVENREQPIERVLVAGEEDLFLVAEVVIKVPLLHVQRGRDLFHGRAVISEPPERGRGRLQDLDARALQALHRCATARRFRPGLARPPPSEVDSLVLTI